MGAGSSALVSWNDPVGIEKQPDGSWAIVDQNTGTVIQTVIPAPAQPSEPASPLGPYPWDPGGGLPGTPGHPYPWDPSPAPADASGKQGGTGAFDLSALNWLAALVLLWIILTALTEYSPNAAMFGQALAGLILLGALFYLGPGAISNVKNIWTDSSSNPTLGPNPVPGA
jgi:hypothetical protein